MGRTVYDLGLATHLHSTFDDSMKPGEWIMKKVLKSVLSTGFLALAALTGTGKAYAALPPHNDPDLEISRIRCQIDIDIDPATGLESPKVQIQGKARSGDAMEAHAVRFMVDNISVPISIIAPTIDTVLELGSATADWDTFPDDASSAPVIDGDFAVDGDSISVTAQVLESSQTVSEIAECATKISAQFTQDTKGVCKLKDFNRGKCKSGDILPDGTIMP
jgi:hypothetical protein